MITLLITARSLVIERMKAVFEEELKDFIIERLDGSGCFYLYKSKTKEILTQQAK